MRCTHSKGSTVELSFSYLPLQPSKRCPQWSVQMLIYLPSASFTPRKAAVSVGSDSNANQPDTEDVPPEIVSLQNIEYPLVLNFFAIASLARLYNSTAQRRYVLILIYLL